MHEDYFNMPRELHWDYIYCWTVLSENYV